VPGFIVALADAGAAPPSWVPWWATLLLASGALAAVGGFVTAIVSVRTQHKNARNLDAQRALDARALENVKSELASTVAQETEHLRAAFAHDLAERTERLKSDLAGELAEQTRRADYVRGQIDHLYGPLAFFVESSAHHISTNRAVQLAYDEYFGQKRHGMLGSDPETTRAIVEEGLRVQDTANRYLALVVENNEEAIKILRAGWGWLDQDDVESAGQYMTDIARQSVEFKENKRLPPLFYWEGAMQFPVGPVSFIRPEFIDRVRRKLQKKQRELAGLTGATAAGMATDVELRAMTLPPAAAPEKSTG
jgi:hypothetical protein